MGRPWYSFYPADYGRDTGHLTLVEHGAYRVLMDHYYSTGAPLPRDEARLMRLCRARTQPEKQAVRFVIGAFFRAGEEGFRHKRIDAEIVKAVEQSERGTIAARIGAAKRQRTLSAEASETAADTPAESQPSQSQPPSQSHETDSLFDDFWSAYPRKEARGPAVIAWGRALELAAPETLIAAAKAYAAKRAGQDAQYTRLPATWLMQQCWLDDAPAAPPDTGEVARAWDGDAVALVAEIGAAAFTAYFAGAQFSRGPPAVIRVAKPHLAALIARRFSGALSRAYGEFSLEVA